jgi:hypothetical protein
LLALRVAAIRNNGFHEEHLLTLFTLGTIVYISSSCVVSISFQQLVKLYGLMGKFFAFEKISKSVYMNVPNWVLNFFKK